MNDSVSEENYIKTIFHQQKKEGTVTTNELAGELKTRPASVTDMMKKLKAKKLLHYQPYQGFRLTTDGSKVALGIIRRHRLWEYFLAEKLKFTWDEVHEVAEELEHVSNKKLIDKDPHGDPIPDAQGKIESGKKIRLPEVPLNTSCLVSGVSNQSGEILDLLKHKKISIGTVVEVRKRFEFDQSLEIRTGKQTIINISRELAENILISYEA